MRKYTIVLINDDEPNLQHQQVVERITYPEAAAAAYKIRQTLGFEWRIVNVSENIKRSHSPDCTSSGTVSLS